jgi:2-oxoglutarate dehydrogenase complex dehydrogenase (E1) component-like enzyme
MGSARFPKGQRSMADDARSLPNTAMALMMIRAYRIRGHLPPISIRSASKPPAGAGA